MAYYVSCKRAHSAMQPQAIAGPFRTHGAALRSVETVSRWAEENTRERAFLAWGTMRRRADHRMPRLAPQMGLTFDADGYVAGSGMS